MATLSAADLKEISADFIRWAEKEKARNLAGLLKTDIFAAVSAQDTLASNSAGTVNNAFPAAFQAAGTADQKAMLVSMVIAKRVEKGVT